MTATFQVLRSRMKPAAISLGSALSSRVWELPGWKSITTSLTFSFDPYLESPVPEHCVLDPPEAKLQVSV